MNELHYGVVVGIDKYPNVSDASDLRFARRDAESFHEWLTAADGGGVPEENAALLKGKKLSEYPGEKDVYKSLGKWHEAVARFKPGGAEWERTRLYVYGAGHGYGPSDGTAALLLADANDGELGCHLEIHHYLQWLRENAPFKEVLLFADCCRLTYKKGPLSNRPPYSSTPDKPRVEVFSVAGYAARQNEAALEPIDPANADEARGVFTRAVLDGLKGSAENSGVVTSQSLAAYVRSTVEHRTKKRMTPQKVEFSADLAQEIEICSPQGPPPLRTVTVTFPPTAHGEAVIKDGDFNVIEGRQISPGSWEVKLRDGYYALDFGESSGGFKPQKFKLLGEDIDVAA